MRYIDKDELYLYLQYCSLYIDKDEFYLYLQYYALTW